METKVNIVSNTANYDPMNTDVLVKGNIETDEFLRLVLKHHNKNRNRLTHAFVIYPRDDAPFILTDAVIEPEQTIATRVDAVIKIAKCFKKCFPGSPQVNFLTPNGHISDKVIESLLASKCVQLLASACPELPTATTFQLDVALNVENGRKKYGKETRRATIISASSLAEGNAIVKAYLLNGAKAFGFVVGADIPVILNSRSNLEMNIPSVDYWFNWVAPTQKSKDSTNV